MVEFADVQSYRLTCPLCQIRIHSIPGNPFTISTVFTLPASLFPPNQLNLFSRPHAPTWGYRATLLSIFSTGRVNFVKMRKWLVLDKFYENT